MARTLAVVARANRSRSSPRRAMTGGNDQALAASTARTIGGPERHARLTCQDGTHRRDHHRVAERNTPRRRQNDGDGGARPDRPTERRSRTRASLANRIAYISRRNHVAPSILTAPTPNSSPSGAYCPAWAPGHTALALAGANNSGGRDLVRRRRTARRHDVTSVAKTHSPSWSPDGTTTRVLPHRPVEQRRLQRHLGGQQGRFERRTASRSAACFNRDPAWSPDGTHIAFWSSREPLRRQRHHGAI